MPNGIQNRPIFQDLPLPLYPLRRNPSGPVLTLIIFTVLGIFAFRRVLISKGYATKRIQFYPVAILAAVLVPSSAAALFLDWAVSHNHCSDSSRGLIVIVIDILAFILYFGALHRAYANLKQLPSLLSPPPDLPK